MKDGTSVRMQALVEGLEAGLQEHLHIKWIGPDGEIIFTKNIDLLPDSSKAFLTSSVGIDPDRKRDAGTYTVEVFRDDSMFASGSFELIPEQG